ncbi:MAG: hypothetical protein GBAus27B_000600 [Mycoplasmataceae bacterium]|nr:MAG: hypothetical protein GBAus27B_000600 [Mycoplasmataceae bacterium]
MQGVKFTNLPTPQGTYTISKQTLETHMSGRWGAPNKFYYFLDDIEKFQKWSRKQFQHHGYKELQNYIAEAAKLGGVFVWTNNGITPEHVFKTQKNSTWRVVGHVNFNDHSLLLVLTGSWRPTFIPINNKELESFYDKFWNVNKKYQRNWLSYIAEEMKGEELSDIISMTEQKKDGNDDWAKEIQLKWKQINQYLKLRSLEEKNKRKQKQNFSNTQKQIKRYRMKTNSLTSEDLKELDKLDRQELTKKKTKSNYKSEITDESKLIELEQKGADVSAEETSKEAEKPVIEDELYLKEQNHESAKPSSNKKKRSKKRK